MNLYDETHWAGRLAELKTTRPSDETFRIGACVVNGRTGLLHAPGRTARLRRKELELLAYLYRRGSSPVDREQLRRAMLGARAPEKAGRRSGESPLLCGEEANLGNSGHSFTR